MADIGDTLVVNISDMIDLAIGTPEVGVVDFNMLQTVLHCMAQQMRILGKNVELRGRVGTLPVLRDNVQTIAVSEFAVDTDTQSTPRNYKEAKEAAAANTIDDSILVVERVKKEYSPETMAHSGKDARGSSRVGGGGGRVGGGGGRDGGGGGRDGGGGGRDGGGGGRDAGGGGRDGGGGGIDAGGGGKDAGGGGGGANSGRQSVGAPPEKLSLVTVSKFNLLQDAVYDLKKRVYGSIPKNEDILEEVRSQSNLKSITDMWTSLNVSSRLEAAENGLRKLSSLVEDLIGETVDLQRRASKTPGKTTRPSTPQAAGTAQSGGKAQSGGTAPSGGTAASSAAVAAESRSVTAPSHAPVQAQPLVIEASPGGLTVDDLKGLQQYVNDLRADLDALTCTFNEAMDDFNQGIESGADASAAAGGGAGTGGGAGGGAGADAEGDPDRPKERKPNRTRAAPIERRQSIDRAALAALSDKLSDVERRLNDCCDDMNKNVGRLTDHVTSMDDQVQYLMKQVAGVSSDLTDGKLSPDLVKDLKGLMELFSTVQAMQDQLQQVHETALKLASEREDRQHHINALLEQIELLKAIKMDREDMAEAMAEKADLCALARKVSHDQFEMACDDLSKGLENAIGKLNMQEALWQQALDDIQREIETKLDKMELSPVKDFFNKKLKQLQGNLKEMASLRREVEAAGTKKKLLRDVNCISCDANAVMQTEAPAAIPSSKPLPPTLSMKPYLSYELDAIRKTQMSNVPQRNMHDWENIDKQMTQPGKPLQKVRSETDKHMCNRYCGGSHTVTTPAQRVARLGHFVKQWGPDVLPLSSGLAAGDDGKMYKVTTAESANVGPGGALDTICTPKMAAKKEAKPAQKPLTISAECRCLDGDAQKE